MAGTIVADTIQDCAGNSTAMDNAIYGSAKAWGNFNGSNSPGTRVTYNMSSFTRISQGQYSVAFTNALSDANYTTLISTSGDQDSSFGSSAFTPNLYRSGSTLTAPTTTGFYFLINWNGSGSADPTYISIAVFR